MSVSASELVLARSESLARGVEHAAYISPVLGFVTMTEPESAS